MTMVIVLGFLAVLLMLALALAMVSRAEKESASRGVDQVRVQLLAESALARATNRLSREFTGNLYPGDSFNSTPSDSSWRGRRYLGSASDDDVAIGDAIGVASNDLDLIPDNAPGNELGWIPVHAANADGDDELIGRYAYLVLDDSGKIDPGAVVSPTTTETADTSERSGVCPSEISLASLGLDSADALRPSQVNDGEPGRMPAGSRWFSMEHIANAVEPSETEFRDMVEHLFPYSYDEEIFWRDRNDNGQWDEGEDEDRLNVAPLPPAERIYALFVGDMRDGETANAEQDDCRWLKDLDGNDWVAAWRTAAGLSPARARQIVAAQVALNIADYADADSVPTRAYVDTGGSLIRGTYSGMFNLSGVESTWGVSEIAARVECDAVMPGTAPGDPDDTVDPTDDVPFQVVSGAVVPDEPYTACVTVLGCQVGLYNTAYNPPEFLYWVPTTVRAKVGSRYLEPWGDWDLPVDADVNDGMNPRTLELPDTYAAGTPVSIETRFWLKRSSSYSGDSNSDWYIYRTVVSSPGNARAFVLTDGDAVPDIPCVWNQESAAYYLQNYVDGSRMALTSNQAVYLFECTGDLTNSIAADYQDIVALITLAPAPPEPVATTQIPRPPVPGRGHGDGKVNICPANNIAQEFVLQKVSGETIDRDDLHDGSFRDWEGEASWIHVKPKGYGNQNGLYIGGELFPLQNGRVYDIIGEDAPMKVTLWNDHRNSDGLAMGDWWLTLEGDATIVPKGEDFAVPVYGLPEAPPTPAPAAVGEGTSLRFRAGFKGEVFHPFLSAAATVNPPGGLEVTYTVEVAVASGARERLTGTLDIPLSRSVAADGGCLMYTPDYVVGDWLEIPGAFDLEAIPVANWYTVTLLQIDQVTLTNLYGDVIDACPGANSFFCNWVSDQTVSGDCNFYAGARAFDPLMNDRCAANADFCAFWRVYPNADTLGIGIDADEADAGVLTHGGYNSAPYSGVRCANTFMTRVGELGRVHSYRPLESLRMWAAGSADQSGSDAAILDLFKARAVKQTRGKVNINTTNPTVLAALFDGVASESVSSVVDALLDARESGTQFTHVGQPFGEIADLTGSNPYNDVAEEAAIARVVELLSVRQNYFTVLVCAQAIRDAAGGPYATNINRETGERRLARSRRGVLDVKTDSNGSAIGYADRILAERKALAVVYRDALSGRTQVQALEPIEN